MKGPVPPDVTSLGLCNLEWLPIGQRGGIAANKDSSCFIVDVTKLLPWTLGTGDLASNAAWETLHCLLDGLPVLEADTPTTCAGLSTVRY